MPSLQIDSWGNDSDLGRVDAVIPNQRLLRPVTPRDEAPGQPEGAAVQSVLEGLDPLVVWSVVIWASDAVKIQGGRIQRNDGRNSVSSDAAKTAR